MLGTDALLLTLLWYEHLNPTSTAFRLGLLLTMIITANAGVAALEQVRRTRSVRKVVGSSMGRLRSSPLPAAYRMTSGFGDALIVLTLIWTCHTWLAAAYGAAALGFQLAQAIGQRQATP